MSKLEQFTIQFKDEAKIPEHIQELLQKADGREVIELPAPPDCLYQRVNGVRVLRIWDVIHAEYVYRADVCFKAVGAPQ